MASGLLKLTHTIASIKNINSHLFGRPLHARRPDVFPVGRLLHRGHSGDGRRGGALLQVLLLPEQELLLVLRHHFQVARARPDLRNILAM